ncbi:MAG: hypothetical protein WB930_04175 [Syntrophobacteraceae bacterium]
MWDDEPIDVLKVQMVYSGQVAGRKAPSFPIETELRYGSKWDICPEFDAVVAAVEAIIQPLRKWILTWDRAKGGADITDLIDRELTRMLGSDDFVRPCCGVRVFDYQAAESANDLRRKLEYSLQEAGAGSGFHLAVGILADQSGFDRSL